MKDVRFWPIPDVQAGDELVITLASSDTNFIPACKIDIDNNDTDSIFDYHETSSLPHTRNLSKDYYYQYTIPILFTGGQNTLLAIRAEIIRGNKKVEPHFQHIFQGKKGDSGFLTIAVGPVK